jgi:glyoxylase-like metal-dependent hydrolase (beta-lactamase superfamily II)
MTRSVVEDWFESRSLSDGVTLFTEPYVEPFVRPNSWHVKGRERDLLVDSGMGIVSLKETLGALGDRPILAVASHSHFDHIGSHHEFAERACHPSEAHILSQPDEVNTLIEGYVNEATISALPFAGYDIMNYKVEPAPATRLLEEGEVIDLGDRVFKVLHLPGHSPGSIGLWEERTGILFGGDAIYDGELIDDIFHSDVDAYIETMQRLAEFPVRVVHGGHRESFGRERMKELIEGYIASKKAPVCPAEVARAVS